MGVLSPTVDRGPPGGIPAGERGFRPTNLQKRVLDVPAQAGRHPIAQTSNGADKQSWRTTCTMSLSAIRATYGENLRMAAWEFGAGPMPH